MKALDEFVVGKRSIGYVSSDFKERFGSIEFEKRAMPTFQKLPRAMSDTTIESELKPGFCELGDVIAFLDNPPADSKDGNWNLFYTSAFVVRVRWGGDEWGVGAWERGGDAWRAGARVFSPATVGSVTQDSGHSDALTLAIKLVKKNGYKIFKEI